MAAHQGAAPDWGRSLLLVCMIQTLCVWCRYASDDDVAGDRAARQRPRRHYDHPGASVPSRARPEPATRPADGRRRVCGLWADTGAGAAFAGTSHVHSTQRWWEQLTYLDNQAAQVSCAIYHHCRTIARCCISCFIKRETPYSWWYLCQIMTSSQNSFTDCFSSKFAVKQL